MAIQKKKHPKFLRPNYGRSSRSRIGLAWRAPRGIDNKKRRKVEYMGASPSIGHRNAKKVRGKRKDDGLRERLVHNVNEAEAVLKEKDAAKLYFVKIAGGVGKKKREAVRSKCASVGVKVSN
jgi:large subunit ribosomal protein L32e